MTVPTYDLPQSPILIVGFFGFLGACLIWAGADYGGWENIYGATATLSSFAFNTLMGLAGGMIGAALLTPFLGPFGPIVGNALGGFLGEWVGKTFLPMIKPLFEPIKKYFELMWTLVQDVASETGIKDFLVTLFDFTILYFLYCLGS